MILTATFSGKKGLHPCITSSPRKNDISFLPIASLDTAGVRSLCSCTARRARSVANCRAMQHGTMAATGRARRSTMPRVDGAAVGAAHASATVCIGGSRWH